MNSVKIHCRNLGVIMKRKRKEKGYFASSRYLERKKKKT